MRKGILALLMLMVFLVTLFRCAGGPTPEEIELQRRLAEEAERQRKAELELQIKIALSNAMEYYKNKQYGDAIRNFRTIIDSLDPDNEIAYKYIADSYFRAGSIDSAELAYKEAIAKYPQKAFLHRGLGYMYLKLNKDSLAFRSFEKAAELDTTDYLSCEALSNLCARRGDIDSAILWAERALCHDSTNEELVRSLVKFYEVKKDKGKLVSAYELLHRLVPDDDEVLLGLGKAYAEAGSLQSARRTLTEYISRKPEDHTGFHLLGLTYFYQKEYTKAIENLRKAGKMNPENPKIDCDIGLVYKELKDYEKAFAYARKALVKKEGYGYAYLLRGSIYEGRGFDKVNPDGTLTYEAKLEFEKAVKEYKKALSDADWCAQAREKIEYLSQYLPTKEEKMIKKFLEEGREER